MLGTTPALSHVTVFCGQHGEAYGGGETEFDLCGQVKRKGSEGVSWGGVGTTKCRNRKGK